jgi:hypothetical protein
MKSYHTDFRSKFAQSIFSKTVAFMQRKQRPCHVGEIANELNMMIDHVELYVNDMLERNVLRNATDEEKLARGGKKFHAVVTLI